MAGEQRRLCRRLLAAAVTVAAVAIVPGARGTLSALGVRQAAAPVPRPTGPHSPPFGSLTQTMPVATTPPAVLRFTARQSVLARRLADAAAASPPPPGIGPLTDTTRVVVWLAPDAAAFDALTGGRAPEWAGGVAIPASQWIVLPAYASRRGDIGALGSTLRHELAHIALHRFLAPASPPRWFDEGYAQVAAGEFDAASAWQIRLAFALHRAPPLDSLDLSWPGGEARARLAYLLSATAVEYLLEASGTPGMRDFLARWRARGDMEGALRATYGVTVGQFEEDWRRFVRRRYGWAFFFSQAAVFWFFASLLLLVLWLRRRRTDRLRMRRLGESEPPDEPAFWMEEQDEEPPAPTA